MQRDGHINEKGTSVGLTELRSMRWRRMGEDCLGSDQLTNITYHEIGYIRYLTVLKPRESHVAALSLGYPNSWTSLASDSTVSCFEQLPIANPASALRGHELA